MFVKQVTSEYLTDIARLNDCAIEELHELYGLPDSPGFWVNIDPYRTLCEDWIGPYDSHDSAIADNANPSSIKNVWIESWRYVIYGQFDIVGRYTRMLYPRWSDRP